MDGSLVVIGVNHQTASLGLREALAPRAEEAANLNDAIRRGAGLAEAVVLATCSRFELYSQADETGIARVGAFLAGRAGHPLDGALYVRRSPDAIKHLFRVSAGLDSWVIGETEILGQVKSAYQQACRENTATRALHLAFQRALCVGKKVRSQTAIVGGIASIGGAAAVLAGRIFTNLEERRILVFGAGTMATSTVRHLLAKGSARLWVANRSPERAQALAQELGGEAMGLEEGFRRLVEADVAVFSTGASGLLDEAAARRLSRERSGKSLFLIDLGLPRNVDPEAGRADGVFLYNMDDLRRLVEDSLRRRESDLAAASAIVEEESADCWRRIAFPSEPRCPLKAKWPRLQTV